MNKDFFYITTAIDYVNAAPHIGHALEKVEADALARFYRQQGKKVFFLTGTDEHGSKIAAKAEELGISPQELVDKNAERFKQLLSVYNISNDDFIRTSDRQKHWPGAQKLWRKLADNGDLIKDKYRGLYCIGCEAFITEKELVNGNCPHHQKPPQVIEEENYFFNFGKYRQIVIDKIESDELLVVPLSRKHEILNILKEAQDRISFSRPKDKLDWGIPVPDDDSQVMYVWVDALSNYITALGYADEGELFVNFWQQGYVTHIIGKDILRFHAAIWPTMLIAAGVRLPDRIFTHGFITSEGQKMSKSLGNVVDPFAIVEKYGTDPVRYYLLREIPAGDDGDFSQQRFVEVYTAELANGIGNLVSRTSNMIATYLEGELSLQRGSSFNWERIEEYTANLQFDKALQEIQIIIDETNKMIDDVKPWQKWKSGQADDREEVRELLQRVGGIILDLAFYLQPFIPQTAKQIEDIFTSTPITKAKPLFPRLSE